MIFAVDHKKPPRHWSEVASHYDDLDRMYRKIWGEHLHHGLWRENGLSQHEAVESLVHLVTQKLNIQSNAKVCDIGCGYGTTARIIANQFSASVTGITLSKLQHKRALRSHPVRGSVKIINRNWLNNRLPDSSYDHALAIESSEHMLDKNKFISEAFRILKSGGTFVICAWLSRNHPRPFESNLLLQPICREGRLGGLATAEEYIDWLRAAGFAIKSQEDLSKEVSRTWSVCIQRTLGLFLKNPRELQILFKKGRRPFDFFQSLFRLRLAYALGSMQYGIFQAIKP